MRTGLSTIQQTLTPEAAAVLNHSIAEAARRSHGQTTPLHVAATLLASPSGRLRRACIRSHPNSSHPLQCRALELCFSVALDRLPSAGGTAAAEPPISNALMAALKRAQAHQRRGCPESQQQPLLAVKVELEQLIVSILDDPSVSRVMREASFSSPAVKATIEQSVASTPTTTAASSPLKPARPSLVPLPANRNLYINPKLQQGKQEEEEVQKVLDVMTRATRRNPVLVGDSDPEAVLREVLWRIEKREVRDGSLRNAQVIAFAPDRSAVAEKLVELRNSVDARVGCGGSVVINLGDLDWFVEGAGQQQQQTVSAEVGRTVAAEVGKLIRNRMFADGGGGGGQVWVIGTATCATYLRCQVYFPAMESDWDLQAVPVSPKPPELSAGSFLQRSCGNGILSSSVEKLAPNPNRGFSSAIRPAATAASILSRSPPPPSEGLNPSQQTMCPACTENYERELSKLVGKEEVEKKSSSSESKPEARPTLPPWLQAARPTPKIQTKDQEELLRRWNETCSRLHPSYQQQPVAPSRPPPALPIANLNHLATPSPLCKTLQLKPSTLRGFSPPLQMFNHHHHHHQSEEKKPPPATFDQKTASPPRSPVRTDLILGRRPPELSMVEQSLQDSTGGCTQDSSQIPQKGRRFSSSFDADSFKRLFKGLTERVSWQQDAASAVSMAITQCRSGNGKKRSGGPKADTWLLFMGPDEMGKRKMASALSELVFGSAPTTVNLGGGGGGRGAEVQEGVVSSSTSSRGKTGGIDRLAEAVRRSPFSVYVLEDVDRADARAQGSIKRAMERGRLMDSHGREVPLGSGIFIMMTSNNSVLPENAKDYYSHSVPLIQYEEKLKTVAKSSWWQFELIVGEKAQAGKRLPEWLDDDDRSVKPPKRVRALSLDLNLATGGGVAEEETGEGSSDVTVENEHGGGELAAVSAKLPPSTFPFEIISTVDDAVVFKPVDFSPVRKKVSDVLSGKFISNAGRGSQLQVDGEALDRIVAGIWFDSRGEVDGFEEWTDRVVVPSFLQLRSSRMVGDGSVVRMVVSKESECSSPITTSDLFHGNKITIAGELQLGS